MIEGAVETLRTSEIRGWVVCPDDAAQPVQLEAFVQGRLCGTAPADIVRPDFDGGKRERGFRIEFPVPLADIDLPDVEVYAVSAAGDRTLMPVLTAEDMHPDAAGEAQGRIGGGNGSAADGTAIDGFFDGVTDGYACGWVLNRLARNERLTVEILEGDRVVAAGDASLTRADLRAAGLPLDDCAFRIELPEWLADGKSHPLRARVKGRTDDLLGFGEFRQYSGGPRPGAPDPTAARPLAYTAAEVAAAAGEARGNEPAADAPPSGRSPEWEAIAGEFDEKYYLARYPRVRYSGLDPISHYLAVGWRENRDPTPWFSTRDYLERNPDVRESGVNPFRHYVENGRRNGRKPNARSDGWQVISEAFDHLFYLTNNPDISEGELEPVQHYIETGWRERRDPAPWFSTRYYVEHNPDIQESDQNPFYHYIVYGRNEGRAPATYTTRVGARQYRPKISVIVPNYNHRDFLEERLDSILEQTYENIDIVILDDKSTDDSIAVIEGYKAKYPDKITTLYNDANSGSVFRQWRKGIEQVDGELIWICESDDSCETNFLETLVGYFADPSIMIAFGRIQFMDQLGFEVDGLDGYRESAAHGIWSGVHIATAFQWFTGAFGTRNVIPNVGGCVFRRQPIPDSIWDEVVKYTVLGDWFVYANLAGGGRIVYDPKAISYFRQHLNNQSVMNFTSDPYYREHVWIAKLMRTRFGTSDEVAFKFYNFVRHQYAYKFGEAKLPELRRLFDIEEILPLRRTQKHILVAFLGFHLGGAEVFAIHLANKLVELGNIVSMMSVDDNKQIKGMRNMLDSRIAVYERGLVDEMGLERFLREAAVDVVNSHNVGSEFLYFGGPQGQIQIPYVVTLHGSYEVTPISDARRWAFLRGVDHWVYTAKKNLGHFDGVPIDKSRLISLPNALEVNNAPFELTRRDLNAGRNDIIFGIASRAHKDKGWEESILALQRAQQKTKRRLVLLLCGEGEELDRLQRAYGGLANVKFLGFHENIHGFYRLCDVCVLATRFQGESFPLSLVQALQVGSPVIATDVGEIKSMITGVDAQAGILLPWTGRSEPLIRNLATAMMQMTDNKFRSARRSDALTIGAGFDLKRLAERYVKIFEQAEHIKKADRLTALPA